jgi:Predicted hydrolases or acyltransferases (alpha/beta hydrolase superfamily)
MPRANANGIQLEYETFGDTSAPALLLVAGNGVQMLFWEAEFCTKLADKGLFVIRFDNRDAGLSTKFEQAGTPDFMEAINDMIKGRPLNPPYTLNDMADDCVGLLDALHIRKAHIFGASMGGMIAQVAAYRHANRFLSLTSLMSNTGNPHSAQGQPEALQAVLAPQPQGRTAIIEHTITVWKKIWSAGFPFEEERARDFIEKSYDRSFCPGGGARQNIAQLAGGDRTSMLAKITMPALVIHGSADPLIPVAVGAETAKAIPNARLLVIEGMGHDMPKGCWQKIIDEVSRHALQADLRA